MKKKIFPSVGVVSVVLWETCPFESFFSSFFFCLSLKEFLHGLRKRIGDTKFGKEASFSPTCLSFISSGKETKQGFLGRLVSFRVRFENNLYF